MERQKRTKITKTILRRNKTKLGGLTLLGIKAIYIVNPDCGTWERDGHIANGQGGNHKLVDATCPTDF